MNNQYLLIIFATTAIGFAESYIAQTPKLKPGVKAALSKFISAGGALVLALQAGKGKV